MVDSHTRQAKACEQRADRWAARGSERSCRRAITLYREASYHYAQLDEWEKHYEMQAAAQILAADWRVEQ